MEKLQLIVYILSVNKTRLDGIFYPWEFVSITLQKFPRTFYEQQGSFNNFHLKKEKRVRQKSE